MKKHKRKTTKKTPKKLSNLKLINIVLALMVLTLSITIFSYYVILNENSKKSSIKKEEILKLEKTENQKDLENYRKDRKDKYFDRYTKEDKYEENTKDKIKEYLPIKKPIENQKEISNNKIKINDKIENKIENPSITKNIENKNIINKANKQNLPKLFIIIDDVTLQSQINTIKDIGYKITMAFMPPTRRHKNSAIIAQNIPSAMIHLPLEASSFKSEEENTLHIGDSYEKIENRIKLLRSLYPNVKYTNNHTGSKFTADLESMEKLFKALDKYNFTFVDSRTTAKSVAKQLSKKYKMPYIVRNIFLDNEKDFTYIQNQLKKAIKISKKRGFAIAIGHPYSITMKVLKESKHLFENLDLVYIGRINNH